MLDMAFGLVGGLGIFLLGMKYMSEGMQAIAGAGLRRMIGAVTNHRLMATGVGTLVTCVVQSSSVTTVMVVGFVNGGLMTLQQAIGVIMGANIGTTITAWLLVLKIGKFGLPMLGVAAFVYLFTRSDRWRYIAMAIMGVGMVFFGLELMKNACIHIKDLPKFEAWFQRFDASTYFGVLKCAAVGCVLTFLVQSSSATLGITIALAATGVIEFDTAAALVLGENMGTTITAILASIGATTNARRAAYFHVLFNVIGVFWITLVFGWYIQIIQNVVPGDVDRAVVIQHDNGKKTTEFPDRKAAIAATHTGFNVVNTLLFLPFLNFFAAALVRYVPDKPLKEKPHLTALDIRMLETPVIAIEQSRVEILRMADGCRKMMDWLRQMLSDEKTDSDVATKLFHREEVLDNIQDEVVVFITNLMTGNLPHSITDEGRRQLRITDEYESISDYIVSIAKFRRKLEKQGRTFNEQQRTQLLELHDACSAFLELISKGYEHGQPEVVTKAHSRGGEIKHMVKSLRDRHLDTVVEQEVAPHVNLAYTASLNSYHRVRDHAINIAEAYAGEK